MPTRTHKAASAPLSSSHDMPMSREGRPGSYVPVQMRRAFEEVADQIREQVWKGALRPGDRLPAERDLAERFNLSRNTVREALRSLEMSGILEFRKGATGGAFVREGRSDAVASSFADLYRLGAIKTEHLTEARKLVSVAVTGLACERAAVGDLMTLQENASASERAVAAGKESQRVELNIEFHRLLARAAGNPVLTVLMDSLMMLQAQLMEVIPPAPDKVVMPSRRRLLRHLLARDKEHATAEMDSHLQILQSYYLSHDTEEADLRAPNGRTRKEVVKSDGRADPTLSDAGGTSMF